MQWQCSVEDTPCDLLSYKLLKGFIQEREWLDSPQLTPIANFLAAVQKAAEISCQFLIVYNILGKRCVFLAVLVLDKAAMAMFANYPVAQQPPPVHNAIIPA